MRQLSSRILPLIAFCLLAAAAPPNAPATKPAPLVIVTKADNTIVRGLLVASDPDDVTLQPPPKSDKTPSDPITVNWNDIKRISNGLTQAKALEQWKTEHAAELCDQCHGDRMLTCPTCKGTGKDPASAKDCKTCGGAMQVKCKAPKCDNGKIPCPKPCLKLTEGHWYKKPDGLMWRNLPANRDGTYMYVSEHHLGQLIVTKDGRTDLGETCPTCGGTTKIDCPECHGAGKVPCPTCKTNQALPKCADCDDGKIKCKACGGTGLKKV